MQFTKLTITNIKRIVAVTIEPKTGRVIEVSGKNNQGKSSALDALWMALGGAKAIPGKPVRKGAKAGQIEVEFDHGKFVVHRTIKASGATTLTVKAKGITQPAPQQLLHQLMGHVGFDPVAFDRMAPAAQREALQRLCGLDLQAIDLQIETAFEDRKMLGRDLKQAEAQFNGITWDASAPDEVISISELVAERDAQTEINNEWDRHQAAVKRQDEVVSNLERELERARDLFERIKANEVAQADEERVAALNAKIDSAEGINTSVRLKRSALQVKRERDRIKGEHERADEKVQSLREQKLQAIADAKMPIPGLGFDDEGVTFDDIPLKQASASQRTTVSTAIAMAGGPELKIACIYDGSLLDSDSKQVIADMAEKHDFTVLMEVVEGDGEGIVIEDGRTK